MDTPVQTASGNEGQRRSLKRIPLLVAVLGMVIAVGGSAVLLFTVRRTAGLEGLWAARMLVPGKEPYTLRMRLHVEGKALTGTVEYTAGNAESLRGTVSGRQISFTARGPAAGANPGAENAFSGNLRGSVIDLTQTIAGSRPARGVARRTD